MHRLLKPLLILALLLPSTYAAINANLAVWEVRPTNGSDNNGACFISGSAGTDFSQQNSPQQVYTDLVAASGTTITSAARPFTSVDVGNCINITSGTGWTTGRYSILSVASNVATMDRTIATGGSTGGHGNFGGAMQNYSSLPGLGSTYSLTKTTAYVKAEATITISARPDFQNGDYLTIIGYTTTRTDGGQVTLTTSNGTDTLTFFRGTGDLVFSNVKFTDTSGTRHTGLGYLNTMNHLVVSNCTFDGNNIAISDSSGNTVSHGIIRGVEIKNQAAAGINIHVVSGLLIENSYIHDNVGNGLDIVATSSISMNVFIFRSVFRANAIGVKSIYDGAISNNSALFIFNSIFASNTSDGLKHVGTGTNFNVVTHLVNNVFYSNGGYGVNIASGFTTYDTYGGNNAFGANTTAARNNYPTLTGDVALSADPFTSASGGDFSLNTTTGGGASLRAAGFKNTANGANTSKDSLDIGAIQHSDPAGASGTHSSPIQ